MNTVLATTEQAGALAAPTGYGIEGMEGIGQADVVIPRYAIVQPTSRADGVEGHEGQFRRNTDGAFRAQLECVVLTISPTRLLWSGDQTERRPECVSRDALTGSVYGACNACDFNQQANPQIIADRRQGIDVKACSYGYSYLLADDPENPESMAFFGVMGTSVRPAKLLHSQFVQRRRPPFSAVVRFSTALEKNDKGKFYVLKAEVARWLDEAETAAWRESFQLTRGMVIREYEEETAGAGGAEEGAALPF